jgi:hypothetical protein
MYCGGSNVSQSVIADGQDCVNWYPEPRQVIGGKTPFSLYPTPGVEARVTPVETPGRAFFEQNGRAFAVIGGTFYEALSVTGGGITLVARGTVQVGANPATIAGGGDFAGQLFITSGDVGYSYDLTTNVLTVERQIGNTMCAMLDGYFIVLDSATSTFYVSDLGDATTWDPTQYAQRSTAPDRWVSLIVPKASREIWLLGQETSEVWNNAGTYPFPFAPIPSALLPFGCAAPFSAREVGGGILWVERTADGQGRIVMVNGGTPNVVSTYALAWATHQYPVITDAYGSSYASAGHWFYLLTFPTQNVTWALDLSTQTWARRGTWVSGSNTFVAWRPRYHVHAFGQHLALDSTTGTIYEVSEAFGLDVDGLPIRRVRVTPSVWRDHDTVVLDSVEVFLEAGVATYSGVGSDPVMSMRISKNGGKTWGPARARSIGQIWEYEKRVRWWACGSGEDIVGEFVVTDPVPWRIIGCNIMIRGGG